MDKQGKTADQGKQVEVWKNKTVYGNCFVIVLIPICQLRHQQSKTGIRHNRQHRAVDSKKGHTAHVESKYKLFTFKSPVTS